MKAKITTIQRMSLHDGPGIRSTLFLKGCNFRCSWCHNPETLKSASQLQHISSKCVSCGSCVQHCPEGALAVGDGGLVVDRGLCISCGKCETACLHGALNIIGKEISVDDALEELLKDRIFYETSSGGVTISGGEPFLQHEFTVELLRRCSEMGLHTAVETNLSQSWDILRQAVPYVDLWMCDLKRVDDTYIINNIRSLVECGAEILVRTPVVPGVNDSEDEISRMCSVLASLGGKLKYELLGFHTLGFGKYADLGMHNPMADAIDLDRARLDELRQILNIHGF